MELLRDDASMTSFPFASRDEREKIYNSMHEARSLHRGKLVFCQPAIVQNDAPIIQCYSELTELSPSTAMANSNVKRIISGSCLGR